MAWTSSSTFEEEVSAALRVVRKETLCMRKEMQSFSELQRESMNLLRSLVTHSPELSSLPVASALPAINLPHQPFDFEEAGKKLAVTTEDAINLPHQPLNFEETGKKLSLTTEDDMETMLFPAAPPPLANAPKPDGPNHNTLQILEENDPPTNIHMETIRSSECKADRAKSNWRPSFIPRVSFMENSGAPKAVFDFKEQVKQQIMRPPRDATIFYKTTGIWQHIARSHAFENTVLFVIGVNALWIAIDTDNNDSDTILNAHWVFQLVENMFCCFFSFELFVKYCAFKDKRDCLKDGWYIFDSILVLFMVIETWLISVILLLSRASSSGSASLLGNAAILRMARLLRLSRMARLARLLRAVPELAILIKGMIASVRSVATTFWLLTIVLYIFAIVFAQLTQGSEANKRFYSVPYSMYYLWLYGVLCLDFAEEITDDFLAMPSLWTGISLFVLYYIFVLLATFTIMNMLIGVLCEVVSAVAASEKEALLLQYAREKLKGTLKTLDLNSDGAINHSEFANVMANKDVCVLLHDLGIDVVGLLDFADVIFDNSGLGDEELEISIEFDNFVDIVLQLRGSSYSTVKDIVELRKLVRTILAQQTSLQDNLAKCGLIPRDTGTIACKGNHQAPMKHNHIGRASAVLSKGPVPLRQNA